MRAPAIVFLTRALDVGGAERQLAELALGLHRAGWRVKVISFYPGGIFEDRLRENGVRVECLGKQGRWDVFGFLYRLVKSIRRERPDIVHGNLALPNVLLTVLRPAWLRSRVVWWVAASQAVLRDDDWLVRLESRLSIAVSRFVDLIVCNSEAGREHHIALGYPAARTVVIPNGIDTAYFAPDAASRSALREAWGVRGDERLLGIVARLDPVKDHANFLRAAAQVAAAIPRTRFVCVGDGPAVYRESLVSLADSLGLRASVIWAGERTDMAAVYNALDLLVSSSVSEGMPNVVAEAMATGLPCVATDVGDTGIVVGDTGWLCPPRDSTALAEAMLLAMSGLPRDPAVSRDRICMRYGVDVMIERSVLHLSALLPSPATRAVA
jgi:glycosyltransferase involved in cell wall biosynthesis